MIVCLSWTRMSLMRRRSSSLACSGLAVAMSWSSWSAIAVRFAVLGCVSACAASVWASWSSWSRRACRRVWWRSMRCWQMSGGS